MELTLLLAKRATDLRLWVSSGYQSPRHYDGFWDGGSCD